MVERDGHGVTQSEAIGNADQAREALLMGLRLTEGIDAATFLDRTGVALAEAVEPETLADAVEAGYLVQTGSRLIATLEGRKRLDALLPVLAR